MFRTLPLFALTALTLAACDGRTPHGEIPRLKSGGQDWTIPTEFQGEWHAAKADCANAADPTRLVITADHINYPTAQGVVMASSASGGGVTIVGEFKGKDGDGQDATWRRAYVFNISPDGQSLTSVEDGPAAVRQKCQETP